MRKGLLKELHDVFDSAREMVYAGDPAHHADDVERLTKLEKEVCGILRVPMLVTPEEFAAKLLDNISTATQFDHTKDELAHAEEIRVNAARLFALHGRLV